MQAGHAAISASAAAMHTRDKKKKNLFLQHGLLSRVIRQKTGHDVVGRQHCGSGCGWRWAIDLARVLTVHMDLQVARMPEGSGAVGADVVCPDAAVGVSTLNFLQV